MDENEKNETEEYKILISDYYKMISSTRKLIAENYLRMEEFKKNKNVR
jgi:hypothetical protein